MTATVLQRRSVQQPQQGAPLDRSGWLRAAQAVISAAQPINHGTGALLRMFGPVSRLATGAGVAIPFRKNGYVETEILPAIGTQSFVEFWYGYPTADMGAKGSSAEPGFLTGSDKNANGICSTLGTNRGGGDAQNWGAIYNWTSNVTLNSSGDQLTPGKLTLLVVVRRQTGMEFWRDGVLVRFIAQAPNSYPAQSLICGSFIEDTGYWTSSSDTLFAGRVLTPVEPTAAEIQYFSENPWRAFQPQVRRIAVAAPGGTNGSATISGNSATARAGTVSATGAASATVTGNIANARVGGVTAIASALATVFGNAAPAQPGTIAASGAALTPVTGNAASGQVGTIAASSASSGTAALLGAAASGQVGTVTPAAAANAALAGNIASSQVGTVTASSAAAGTATLTGNAATARAGVIAPTAGAAVSISGVAASAQVGTVSATAGGNANAQLVGAQAIANVGPMTGAAAAFFALLGISASAATGPMRGVGAAKGDIGGIGVDGQTGTVIGEGGAQGHPAGVSASGQVGTIAASGEISPDVVAYIAGVAASARTGTMSAVGTRSKIETNTTEDDVCKVVRAYIKSIAPDLRVIRTPVNKASTPDEPYVAFTPGMRRPLSTNVSTYDATGRFVGRSEQMTFQIDCYGDGASDLSETLNVLFRDEYAATLFAESGVDVTPLYAGPIMQAPFVNDADQYEDRYTFEIEVQVKPTIVVPQQSCNMLDIDLISVDATFPP